MRELRRPVLAPLVALAFAFVAVGCVAPAGPTFPPQGATPPPAGDATAAVQARIIAALAGAGLEARPATRSFRPPESARLAAAPRSIVEVVLAQDPDPAPIVVYAFESPEAARAAADEQAAYIRSGPGGIQFQPDSRFVLRVEGPVVLFFSWSPGSSPDPRTGEIADALARIGDQVPIRA
jgi:hypothetical protein